MERSKVIALKVFVISFQILNISCQSKPTAPPTYLNYQKSSASFDPNRAFIDPGTELLGAEVELSISARKLRGRDVLSKSDPMCVVYTKPFGSNEYKEYARTEMIKDNHNPKFTRKITMPFAFEEVQPLRFELYDVDTKRPNLDDHDFLGYAECYLAELMNAGRKKIPLIPKSSDVREFARGSIIITAEELISNFNEVYLHLSGIKLDRKDWFGKSDPYIEIYKRVEAAAGPALQGDDGYTLVYHTKVVRNSLNPRWDPFVIPIKKLCNGDYDRNLKFICWDWDRFGKRDLIGEFQTDLREIELNNRRLFDLKNYKKMKRRFFYKNSGRIKILDYRMIEVPSFADFVRGGLQIQCSVAIDFTSSNGNPRTPQSLHYRDSTGALNKYEEAIQSVVQIIEFYDSDKKIPTFGFGGRFGSQAVDHAFNVNLTKTPECDGVEGVLEAYRNCLKRVTLSSPTNFAPIIRNITDTARDCQNHRDNYFILLILTDGEIMDMPATQQAIVQASDLPISIIIVGIGNSTFENMEILDGDHIPLAANGVPARRDIVQFVPFRKFQQSDNPNASLYLAREVLAEVPYQVASFMKSRDYKPRPPIFAHSESLASSIDSPRPGKTPEHEFSSSVSGKKGEAFEYQPSSSYSGKKGEISEYQPSSSYTGKKSGATEQPSSYSHSRPPLYPIIEPSAVPLPSINSQQTPQFPSAQTGVIPNDMVPSWPPVQRSQPQMPSPTTNFDDQSTYFNPLQANPFLPPANSNPFLDPPPMNPPFTTLPPQLDSNITASSQTPGHFTTLPPHLDSNIAASSQTPSHFPNPDGSQTPQAQLPQLL